MLWLLVGDLAESLQYKRHTQYCLLYKLESAFVAPDKDTAVHILHDRTSGS